MRRMTPEDAERLLGLSREADFLGPEASTWVERLRPESELVDAAGFFVEHGRADHAAELAANVWRLWLLTGNPAGGREFLATALSGGNESLSRARALALYGDGLLAFRQGAQEESQRSNQDALAIARALGDAEVESLALVGLSRIAFREGDNGRVRSLALQAYDLVCDGDPSAAVAPLHMLAAGTRLSGEPDAAVALYHESLALNRRLGDARMIAAELHNIGHVELHRGNVGAAEQAFAECARLRNPQDPYDVAMTHLNEAALACERGQADVTAEHVRECESTLEAAGIALDPDDAHEVAWLRERVTDELPDARTSYW
jgi:tetratricopeptide (TPR) repeat protein